MNKGKKARECGCMVEERMRKMFKGKKTYRDEVDFETKNYLYEVKSCSLFNKCYNGNDKRRNKTDKKIKSTQLGRFFIRPENHFKLWLEAKKVGKIAKYVFCLRLGKQVIFRVLTWDNVIVPNTEKPYHHILVKDIFREKPSDEKPVEKPINRISELFEEIRASDKGGGAEIEKIAKTDEDKRLIDYLKEHGEIYECKPGMFKIIE